MLLDVLVIEKGLEKKKDGRQKNTGDYIERRKTWSKVR